MRRAWRACKPSLNPMRPWAKPSARGVRHGDGRLEMEVTLTNAAPRAIERAPRPAGARTHHSDRLCVAPKAPYP